MIIFYKKQQILIQKAYQFINVVNGVSRSHKTANIFFSFDYGHRSQEMCGLIDRGGVRVCGDKKLMTFFAVHMPYCTSTFYIRMKKNKKS